MILSILFSISFFTYAYLKKFGIQNALILIGIYWSFSGRSLSFFVKLKQSTVLVYKRKIKLAFVVERASQFVFSFTCKDILSTCIVVNFNFRFRKSKVFINIVYSTMYSFSLIKILSKVTESIE